MYISDANNSKKRQKRLYARGNAARLISMGLLMSALVPFPGFAATTLNFKEADINAVIQSVADITGKNFIVDPRVKGKVTIISKRPMSEGEIYQVFLTVLDVHGFSAIPTGKIIKIIPDADAKHAGMPTADEEKPGVGDEAVTRVIQIDHVNAAQLVPILRPLVPPQGHLAAYPQSNVLIVTDRARNIERLLKIISRVDQPTSGEVEIIQVENASAADLVRVLTSLEQAKQQGGGQTPTEKAILVADERTNSILIGGERSDRLQIRAIISHLDTPSEVEGDTHVMYLRYANAKDLVPVLTGVAEEAKKTISTVPGGAVAPGAAPGAARGQPIFNIQADESSNSLVITAPPALFRSLESVIRQLDVRRAQVLVEAIIAEVSMDKSAQLGIEWFFDGHNSNKPVGAINFTGAGAAVAGLTSSVTATGDEIASGLTSLVGQGATIAFGRFNSESFNFAAVLKALEGDGDTNILSTPSIVTLDNEEAEIFVGEEVSIPTGSFTSTGTGVSQPTNPFTTFDRKPVGINLKVKPQINEGDTILLTIEQSIDAFKSGSAGSQDIVTSQRKINTSVLVDNGKILVLGGLVQDNLIKNDQSVPFFGDIPIIGALFRSSSTQKVKTNLMVFLRPLVMRDSRQGLLLTNSKYNYIRELQLQSRESESYLLPTEPAPLLPEFDVQLELPPAYVDLPDKDQGVFRDGDLAPSKPQLE